MGTRADFYIGTGDKAEWLGSIGWDGYYIAEMKKRPTIKNDDSEACWAIKTAKSESVFRDAVAKLLLVRDDATKVADGWPWPWADSTMTDYAYAFVDGKCKIYRYGKGASWPDMTARRNVTYGKRSGLLFYGGFRPKSETTPSPREERRAAKFKREK